MRKEASVVAGRFIRYGCRFMVATVRRGVRSCAYNETTDPIQRTARDGHSESLCMCYPVTENSCRGVHVHVGVFDLQYWKSCRQSD